MSLFKQSSTLKYEQDSLGNVSFYGWFNESLLPLGNTVKGEINIALMKDSLSYIINDSFGENGEEIKVVNLQVEKGRIENLKNIVTTIQNI